MTPVVSGRGSRHARTKRPVRSRRRAATGLAAGALLIVAGRPAVVGEPAGTGGADGQFGRCLGGARTRRAVSHEHAVHAAGPAGRTGVGLAAPKARPTVRPRVHRQPAGPTCTSPCPDVDAPVAPVGVGDDGEVEVPGTWPPSAGTGSDPVPGAAAGIGRPVRPRRRLSAGSPAFSPGSATSTRATRSGSTDRRRRRPGGSPSWRARNGPRPTRRWTGLFDRGGQSPAGADHLRRIRSTAAPSDTTTTSRSPPCPSCDDLRSARVRVHFSPPAGRDSWAGRMSRWTRVEARFEAGRRAGAACRPSTVRRDGASGSGFFGSGTTMTPRNSSSMVFVRAWKGPGGFDPVEGLVGRLAAGYRPTADRGPVCLTRPGPQVLPPRRASLRPRPTRSRSIGSSIGWWSATNSIVLPEEQRMVYDWRSTVI